jgi:hypothetical protein
MQMEKQQQTNWCWAAVAVSVHNFLDPGSGLTQGEIATPVLRDAREISRGVDCTATPGLCNIRAALHVALTITGNLETDGYLRGERLLFRNVKNWVDADLPVGARIVWATGGAHFVVLDGYREFQSGAQQVHVRDPLYGPSFQFFEDFVADYPPGGNWQDTYLMKKNGGA